MKFKNFIKQIKSFFKHNFKRLSFSFVALVSALVLFCIPVSAVTNFTYKIQPWLGLYATNSSIREGDFSNDNWGIVFQTLPFSRQFWIPTNLGSNNKGYYEVIYDKEQNSFQLQNKYLVTTFQLTSWSPDMVIRSDKTYKVTLTLFFKMATDKVLETDFMKVTFWDILDNSYSPYLNFFSDEHVEWNSSYNALLGGYVSKHTFYLKNDKGKDIVPTHLRFAIRFKSTLKLWQGNSWGFYDNILIEESQYTLRPDGSLDYIEGMRGLKDLLNEFIPAGSFLRKIIQYSITLGIVAVVVGFVPAIVSSYTHKFSGKGK